MTDAERLALAARLHVLLRRITGRVTDTEWLASNVDYAREIVRFGAQAASEGQHDELAQLLEKFAAAMLGLPAGNEKVQKRPFFGASAPAGASAGDKSQPGSADKAQSLGTSTGAKGRYVGGLR